MNNIEQEFKKLFGDMYLSESETALRIFEYGYKAGAAAENEACAVECDKWAAVKPESDFMHGSASGARQCAAAIRGRMK